MPRRSGTAKGCLVVALCFAATLHADATGLLAKGYCSQKHLALQGWIAPKSKVIPQDYMEAVEWLSRHGFADPTGGRLVRALVLPKGIWPQINRHQGSVSQVNASQVNASQVNASQVNASLVGASLDVSSVEGPNRGLRANEKTGWLMPKSQDGKPILVGMDGLEYPVLKLLDQPGSLTDEDPSNNIFAPPSTAVPCLLLRGETHWAEVLYAKLRQPHFPQRSAFRSLSEAYLLARYNRAIDAHLSGEDNLALADGSELLKELPSFTSRLEDDFARPLSGQSTESLLFEHRTPKEFTALVRALVEDSRRRLNLGYQKKLEPRSLLRLSPNEQVRRLIANLDEIPSSDYDGPCLLTHPVFENSALGQTFTIQGLIDAGDLAVGPLIDTIEADDRLTRFATNRQPFWPDREVITVKEVAYRIVQQLLSLPATSPVEPPLTSEALRKAWAKVRIMSPSERLCRTLVDETAGEARWMAAAKILFAGQVSFTLDSSQKSTLLTILKRRMDELLAHADEPATYPKCVPDALQLGLYAAHLTQREALPAIREATQRVMYIVTQPRSAYWSDGAGDQLGRLIVARADLGDPSVIDEYLSFLQRLPFSPTTSPRIFYPLVRWSSIDKVEATTQRLFAEHSSPWSLTMMMGKPQTARYAAKLLMSPLLGLPVVQKQLAQLLSDKTVVGEVWVEGRSVFVSDDRGSHGIARLPEGADRSQDQTESNKLNLRAGDVLAQQLCRLRGAPHFGIYWSYRDRDEAIQALVKYLDAAGPGLVDLIPWTDDWEHSQDSPRATSVKASGG